jgi:hypothetical protein
LKNQELKVLKCEELNKKLGLLSNLKNIGMKTKGCFESKNQTTLVEML